MDNAELLETLENLKKDKNNLNSLSLLMMAFIKKNDLLLQWQEYFDSHIELFKTMHGGSDNG